MMSSRKEKLVTAGCSIIILSVGLALIVAGSFIPKWASAKNTTADGNVSYSLWTREECFGIICRTEKLTVQFTNEECWIDPSNGRQKCEMTRGYKLRTDTKCYVANYCNTSWMADRDFESMPSLLFVAKAFETPAVASALLSIVLYVIKIVLLVRCPDVKRLHLKAAYLTFGAIAGFTAAVGVVIFCVMLDKEQFELQWAPYLNGAGGGLYILFGGGGYLSWRNRASGDDFDDDRSEYEKEFSEPKTLRPFLDNSMSRHSTKSEVV